MSAGSGWRNQLGVMHSGAPHHCAGSFDVQSCGCEWPMPPAGVKTRVHLGRARVNRGDESCFTSALCTQRGNGDVQTYLATTHSSLLGPLQAWGQRSSTAVPQRRTVEDRRPGNAWTDKQTARESICLLAGGAQQTCWPNDINVGLR